MCAAKADGPLFCVRERHLCPFHTSRETEAIGVTRKNQNGSGTAARSRTDFVGGAGGVWIGSFSVARTLANLGSVRSGSNSGLTAIVISETSCFSSMYSSQSSARPTSPWRALPRMSVNGGICPGRD